MPLNKKQTQELVEALAPPANPTKYVTIAIKMDSTFVRLLNANVELSQLRERDDMDPMQQLALIALLEARGALEGEVHAAILPAWRPHIEVVWELRKAENK